MNVEDKNNIQTNLYSINAKNIQENEDIIITVGNIQFQIIFRTFNQTPAQKELKFSPDHAHPYYELHMINDGTMKSSIEDSVILLEDNTSLLIFPQSYHSHISTTDNCHLSTLSFFISPRKDVPGTDYYSIFKRQLAKYPGFFVFNKNARNNEYFQQIMRCSDGHSPFKLNMQKALLVLLFSELITTICKDLKEQERNPNLISEKDFRMQNIQYFFIKRYNENITLGHLAKILKLSEKQTGRLVRKYCGTDFQTHLSEIRLKNAKKLLKDGDDELQKIAEAVGYKSYNGFYLAFKKHFGITPLAYRKKHR